MFEELLADSGGLATNVAGGLILLIIGTVSSFLLGQRRAVNHTITTMDKRVHDLEDSTGDIKACLGELGKLIHNNEEPPVRKARLDTILRLTGIGGDRRAIPKA